MIAKFAEVLRNSIPAGNFIGRSGGDEFITGRSQGLYFASATPDFKCWRRLCRRYNGSHHAYARFTQATGCFAY